MERLDLFLIKGKIRRSSGRNELEVLCFPSDHNIVVLRCTLDGSLAKIPEKIIFDWNSSNFDEFSRELDDAMAEAPVWEEKTMSLEEINEALNFVTLKFNMSLDNWTKSFPAKPKFVQNISADTRLLIDKLRADRGLLQHRKRNNTNGMYNQEIAALSNSTKLLEKILREKVRMDRQEAFAVKCQQIKPGPDLFKEIKKVSEYKLYNPVPESMEVASGASADRKVHVEEMGQMFAKIHMDARDRIDASRRMIVNFEMDRRFNNNVPLMEFSATQPAWIDQIRHHEDVLIESADGYQILASLNNKCSRGADGVPNKLLKKVGAAFVRVITVLLNQMNNRSFTPDMWKLAVMCPLRKSGKPADQLSSYRPISLISNLSKIWEKIINAKFSSWMVVIFTTSHEQNLKTTNPEKCYSRR